MTFPPEILLATSNPGKIKEFELSIKNFPVKFISQISLDIPEIPETGLSFLENALIKARHAARFSMLPVISDDSGLIVDALDGAPGIYSARYGEPGMTRDEKNALLLTELAKQNLAFEQRTARLYCVLVFLKSFDDPLPLVSSGCWEGLILDKPQGTEGFGYEPVFYLPEFNCTAAQISLTEKLNISHRGKAIQQLMAELAAY